MSVFCDPVDCNLAGSSVHGLLQARKYWSGLPFPSPGDLPDPGIEPGSLALQADILPSEPHVKSEMHIRHPSGTVTQVARKNESGVQSGCGCQL